MGGVSSEHDVSICTGLNVLDALDSDRHVGIPVYLRRDGAWAFGERPPLPSLEASRAPAEPRQPAASSAPAPAPDSDGVLERLRDGAVADVMFIALHGPGGEDGTIQALCVLAGLPFTGSGVLASALAMDKAVSKRLLVAAGVPMAADVVLSGGSAAAAIRAGAASLGYPCVVKPVAGGSSFATSVVTSDEALLAAVAQAGESGDVMIEEYLDGVEVTCGVLGGGSEPTQVLPLTEIAPAAEGFFDFRAKYTAGACSEITPARVDDATTARVQELAVIAHNELGCEGCSRSDFIVTAEGPRMLELNTIPGMTETSLLPQGAAAAGVGFAELVDRLLASALARG
jgi:D-alanine-D-alanine ligase